MALGKLETSSYEVCLLGSSYIRRLAQFMFSGRDSAVHPDFGIQTDSLNVYFKGIGGARADTIEQILPQTMQRYRPDIVVLHVGGNDILTNSQNVQALAEHIFHIAMTLHTVYGVRQVIVSQILSRRTARCSNYNELAVQLNVQLSKRIQQACLPGLIFWKHRGFWSADARAEVQHQDGVHLNHVGNFKFYQSFKSAILQAVCRLKKM